MKLLKLLSLLLLAFTFVSTSLAANGRFSKPTGVVEKVGDKYFFTDNQGDRYEFERYNEEDRRGTYVDKDGKTFAVDPEGGMHRVWR